MLVKLYIYSLISMHCTTIITYLYINAGILQLLCNGKAVQKCLTFGTKIDEYDIAINDTISYIPASGNYQTVSHRRGVVKAKSRRYVLL